MFAVMFIGILLLVGPVSAGVLITWGGSGTSGTDPYGHGWSVLNDWVNTAQDSWGIPGLGAGTLSWGGPVAIHDFHITFTDLPPGVAINPLPPPGGPGGSDDSTRFSNLGDLVLWDRVISGNQVSFYAPDMSAALDPGDGFFVNVVFTGLTPGGVTFEASYTVATGAGRGCAPTREALSAGQRRQGSHSTTVPPSPRQ
jgi:hypothetical protein